MKRPVYNLIELIPLCREKNIQNNIKLSNAKVFLFKICLYPSRY